MTTTQFNRIVVATGRIYRRSPVERGAEEAAHRSLQTCEDCAMPLPPSRGNPASAPVQGQATRLRWSRIALYLAVIAPALLQFCIVVRQQFPFPYQDDYPAVLGFALHYEQLHGLRERLVYIVEAQHNEYKLIFQHVLFSLQLLAGHRINFVELNLIGDCFVLLIGFVLWKMTQVPSETMESKLLRFLPISLIFFSLNYWEGVDWAAASLVYFPVIFWVLLSIYLLFAPDRKASRANFVLGCVAAMLAASASANGFLLLPVGLLGLWPARAYKKAILWCCAFCPPLVAYLYHYVRPSGHAQALSVHHVVLFFCAFLGSALPHRWPAALLGVGLLGLVALASRTRFVKLQPAICLSVVWICGTALLTAWVRGRNTFFIASRYSMYSNLMLVFCLTFARWHWHDEWTKTARRRWYVSTVAVALLFCLTTDALGYLKLGARRHMVERGIAFYAADPTRHSPTIDPIVAVAFPKEKAEEERLLNEAIQENVYRLPAAPGTAW